VLVALLLALLVAGPAHATDPLAEAARYFAQGNAAYDEGRYEEAVRMFRVCLALAPELAGPQRRLGQALKRLGRCDEALDHYLAYLQQKPTGSYADEIRAEMAQCVETAAPAPGTPRPGVAGSGTLVLVLGIDGASVRVDGAPVGSSPLPPLSLPAGPHTIEVQAAGFVDAVRTIELTGGEELELAISLEQQPEPPPPPPPPPPSGPATLQLSTIPAGARVLLDGQLVGLSPVPILALEPGNHGLQVTKPGFLPEQRVLEAKPGAALVLELKLVRSDSARAVATAGPLPGEPAGQLGLPTVVAPDSRPAAVGRQGPSLGTWTAFVAGGTLLATGAILGGVAISRASGYDSGGENTDRRALKDSGEKLALAADLTGGTGLALLGLGVGLYFWPSPPPASTPVAATPAAVVLQPLIGPGLLGLAGGF
jgi:hypothetical protein